MPKVKMLRNTGTKWHKERKVPLLEGGKLYEVNKEYDVTDDVAKVLFKEGLAETVGTFHAVPEGSPLRGVPQEHVSQTDEAEALSTINKLKNKDALQNIVDHDSRPAVKEAARKRLGAL